MYIYITVLCILYILCVLIVYFLSVFSTSCLCFLLSVCSLLPVCVLYFLSVFYFLCVFFTVCRVSGDEISEVLDREEEGGQLLRTAGSVASTGKMYMMYLAGRSQPEAPRQILVYQNIE